MQVMWEIWKYVGIAYLVALIPSLFVTMVFIRDNRIPQLGKFGLFISIWLVMPLYLIQKLIHFIISGLK